MTISDRRWRLRPWAGLYLLSYGILLEVAEDMVTYQASVHWFHTAFLLAFSVVVGLRISVRVGQNWLRFTTAATTAAVMGLCLLYLPWFTPFYDGAMRFGWPESTVRSVAMMYRVGLIVSGSWLLGA